MPDRPLRFIASPALLFALLMAPTAHAGELKLVLEAEPGGGLPARVCLATRARGTAGARGDFGVVSLASVTTCADGRCTVDRGAPPARCATCPDAPHADCQGQVVTGRFPAEAWSVVCADDDTYPPAGGTVYIAVEAVEAENPPEFYDIEVSGGRVRWSPLGTLSKPSYRVMGGDFEASNVAYPRGSTTPEWVQIPVRRRCRCIETRQPTGGAPIVAVTVDDGPVCHGPIAVDGRLPVEVPFNRPGRSRSIVVETSNSKALATWVGRWPETDIATRLTDFQFDARQTCIVPRGEGCPQASATRATCTATGPNDDVCHYACTVAPGAALALPVSIEFGVDPPEIRWQQVLDQPGQLLRHDVPPARRVLSIDLPAARFDMPGDRVEAITVSRFGIQTNRLLVGAEGPKTLHLPMPDLRCNSPLTVTYRGDRTYHPATAQVSEGGRVEVPSPERQGGLARTKLAVLFGIGQKHTESLENATTSNDDTLLTVKLANGFRFRRFGRPWFGEVRINAMFTPNWVVAATFEFEDQTVRRLLDRPALMATSEAVLGWTFAVNRSPLDISAGAGFGGAYLVSSDTYTDIGFIGVLTGTLGIRWPIDGAGGRWAVVGEAQGIFAVQQPPVAVFDGTLAEAGLVEGSTAPSEAFIEQSFEGFVEGETYSAWALSGMVGLDYLF